MERSSLFRLLTGLLANMALVSCHFLLSQREQDDFSIGSINCLYVDFSFSSSDLMQENQDNWKPIFRTSDPLLSFMFSRWIFTSHYSSKLFIQEFLKSFLESLGWKGWVKTKKGRCSLKKVAAHIIKAKVNITPDSSSGAN